MQDLSIYELDLYYFIIHLADKEHIDAAKKLTQRDLVIPECIVVDGVKNKRKNKPLPPNNKEQQTAIDKALGSRFTLIQGPPGIVVAYSFIFIFIT